MEDSGNELVAKQRRTLTWDEVKALALNALPSSHSRRAYGQALEEFVRWASDQQIDAFTKGAVQQYRVWLDQRGLAASSINIRLTAVRRLAAEAADNGLLDPHLAAGIGRVKGAPQKGRRIGHWLTREEARRLLRDREDLSLKGKRDRAILCLLIGSGLRREELTRLQVDQLQRRDDRWVIADLTGKGQRIRTVPIPAWARTAVERWMEAAYISQGRLFRAMDKAGRVTGSALSPQAIYLIVTGQARAAGFTLAPHDARRTFAKLAHKGLAPLEQIQLSLGHDSILTTEKYLGVRQDLTDAPCDRLGLDLG